MKKGPIIAVVVVLLLVVGLVSNCSAASKPVPDVTGMSVTDAKNTLKDAEFTNVETETEGGVFSMMSEGYSVVSQNPSAGTEVKTSEKITLEIKSDSVAASEAKQAEATEAAKRAQSDKAKNEAAVAATVGTKAKDAYDTLVSKGYGVKINHASTGLDFTSTIVEGAEDPDNPFLVVKYEGLDAAKKTVTLVVNTQTNMDSEAASDALRSALDDKLPASYAWTAAESYGKAQFPYGFKLKDFMGRLAEEPKDENTWFLKATCNVTNAAGGTAKDLTCEAEVTGTKDNPQVVSFNVY